MNTRITILSIMCLWSAPSIRAQLFGVEKEAMGGGTWEGCDTSLSVAFTDHPLGALAYRFEPDIDTGATLLFNMLWSYYDGGGDQVFIDTLEHTFSGPGEHLVCLTANAYDLELQQPCSTTTCRIIDILQDPSCDSLEVDFTIAAVDGQTITFVDLTTFSEGLSQWLWSFDDGGSALTLSPQHTFDGPGPHKICLTVTGPPPIQCTATLCQWLYLGPAPVPCELLFTPGFLMLQYQNMVGVLDTSITSGMNSAVSWSFGDGSAATGRYALHAYPQDGTFELCSTVNFWGPLLADTCSYTECKPVVVMEALGVADEIDEGLGTRAWPVPFNEVIYLACPVAAPGVTVVFDASGSPVHEQRYSGSGLIELNLGHLAPGAYLIRCTSHQAVHVARVLKN